MSFESQVHRPAGWISVDNVFDAEGRPVSVDQALRYGWIRTNFVNPNFKSYDELNAANASVAGPNLFVDNGRQLLAYCFGERSPISSFTCKNFGLGTGTFVPKVTDVALEQPITFFGASQQKPVSTIDYSVPFVARVEFVIAAGEANGYLITEMGLFSGDGTLIARRVHAGINKTSDWSPVLGWRTRF
jgi:hypothetical protein